MDYTREPIVETVVTPKDGYRLAVRSSKTSGQEEFVVDALEVITFGANCFFRSLERPRAFMVPASDYEIIEIRETKLALKAASLESSVRPSGPKAAPREQERRRPPKEAEPTPAVEPEPKAPVESSTEEAPPERRHERRSDRRRGQRRRRGGRDELPAEGSRPLPPRDEREVSPQQEPVEPRQQPAATLLPPPQTLIRDDIERLRQNEQYKGAFYLRESDEEARKAPDVEDIPIVPFNLQGDESRSDRPPEEDIYRATPAPSEE